MTGLNEFVSEDALPDLETHGEPVEVQLSGFYDRTDETIALIRVRPQDDPRVQALAREAEGLRDYALALIIKEESALKEVTETLTIIATGKKALNEAKVTYVKPIRAHLDEVNDAFATIIGPLEEADKLVRAKILEYRQAVARRQAEEEEINRLRLEAAQKEMALKGELSEPVGLLEITPDAPARVRTGIGMAHVVKVRKWRVVDFAMLPDQYKMENAGLLTKVVKAGIQDIPGVEIYEEETLAVRPETRL